MRWTPLDKEYVELDHILKLNMQETLLLQLLKSANRRLFFLLKLKKNMQVYQLRCLFELFISFRWPKDCKETL